MRNDAKRENPDVLAGATGADQDAAGGGSKSRNRRGAKSTPNGEATPDKRAQAAQARRELRRLRLAAASQLSEVAYRLSYWIWHEGWEGHEPELLADLVRDMRVAAAKIRRQRCRRDADVR
jgi:hypothetical protein